MRSPHTANHLFGIGLPIAAALTLAAFVSSEASAQAAKSGKALFDECAACHSVGTDAKPAGDDVGPNLHGVFGRKAGSRDDFRYSGPMKRSALVWNHETL